MTPGAAVLFSLLLFLDTDGWLFALLPGVLFHELGHLTALRICGGKAKRMRLDAAGLRIDVTPFTSDRQALFCTAAGPAAGFVWVAIAGMIGTAWCVKSAAAALVINCFNLLPALPLDGGEIFFILTGSRPAATIASRVTAAALLLAFLKWRAWGLLVPAALIIWTAFSS